MFCTLTSTRSVYLTSRVICRASQQWCRQVCVFFMSGIAIYSMLIIEQARGQGVSEFCPLLTQVLEEGFRRGF